MNDLCVVFDIDDTLYLEHDYVMSGFNAAGQWALSSLGIPDFAIRCQTAHLAGQRGNIFNSALEASAVQPHDDLIQKLVHVYRSHQPDIRMCDDAASALEEISRRWPVAVITDGPAISQSRKAEALHLARFADPIYLTECLGEGCAKPSTVAYEAVMRAIPGRNYVYIADNPLKDFTAPLQLGWTAIRIRRPGGLHFSRPNSIVQPHFEFPDCRELPKLLDSPDPRNTGAVA